MSHESGKQGSPQSAAQAEAEREAVHPDALFSEVDACPTLLNISRVTKRLAPQRDDLARVGLKVACVSSFTFDPLKPALELQGLRAGMGIHSYISPYGQYEQELINPSAGLADFRPDVVLVTIRLQDVCRPIYDEFNGMTEDDAKRVLDDWINRLSAALQTYRERASAYILMQNYDLPAVSATGITSRGQLYAQADAIEWANKQLARLAESIDNLYVMDYDGLVARMGRRRWSDPRTEFYARIPIANDHYWPLTGFYIRHLRPLYGLSKKAIVLDADNTLWGGVVGDAGPNGIELGNDFPGNAYVAFQKRILDLHHRGIILAIASKNEPGSVESVLQNHPDMVLRPEHFATTQINWNPKPDNLRQIAEDLNLGLDAFVFMDDSPVECEMMRTALPQVLTIPLPKDPAAYPDIIESLDCFDQWTISAEDRKRGELYKAEAGRREFQRQTVDLPTFYRHLEMQMTLFIDCVAHVARASQMTNRTNQFNMNTIRCSEDDIRKFMAATDHEVITLALRDRFGDNGVVGLAVVRRREEAWTLHLFLMSCRVLGRTVEQTVVRWIKKRAQRAGVKQLTAEFVPTSKNKPFAGFYRECGFNLAGPSSDIQRWECELEGAETDAPDWMAIDIGHPDRQTGT
ncbi:MAG: HAD-IIIC family phosphatase [Phycisphaerales bacterium]|nr:HAD-IIIC family phosphatase [Phycisphaerales bacterium]